MKKHHYWLKIKNYNIKYKNLMEKIIKMYHLKI